MAWIDPGTAVDSAMSSLTTAGLITYLLQWLKKSHWFPWLTMDSKALLRFVNAAAALAVSIGLSWVYNADAHQLVIAVPTVGALFDGLWTWGKQWALQQMAYDGIIVKSEPTNG